MTTAEMQPIFSEKQYIISESYETARNYAVKNSIHLWTYVKGVDTLRGIAAGTPIICHGHWDLRLDYMALRRTIAERRLLIVVGRVN